MQIKELSELINKMVDEAYQKGYNEGLKRALDLVKKDTGLDEVDIERRRAECQ